MKFFDRYPKATVALVVTIGMLLIPFLTKQVINFHFAFVVWWVGCLADLFAWVGPGGTIVAGAIHAAVGAYQALTTGAVRISNGVAGAMPWQQLSQAVAQPLAAFGNIVASAGWVIRFLVEVRFFLFEIAIARALFGGVRWVVRRVLKQPGG